MSGDAPEPNPATGQRPRLPPVFPSLAYLYGPADGNARAEIQEADAGWTMPRVDPEVDILLWGRIALNARPSLGMLPTAMAREATIARLRMTPPGGLRLADLHRLPAVRRPGRVRNTIRNAILGGVVLELVRGDRPARVIDEVVAAAGGESLGRGLRPSGDGSAVATLPIRGSSPVELRVARLGHPKARHAGFAALEALQAADVPMVPRPVRKGTTAGAAWSTETRLPGDHTASLTPALLDELIDLLATLPGSASPQTASDGHLREVAWAFPQHADELAAVAEAIRRWWDDRPSVMVHGDLWLNNLLVEDGRLTGLFDWETWHPAGIPGADLLDILAAEDRTRSRLDIGEQLMDGFWRSTDVVAALHRAFAARGLPAPDAMGLAAIGVGQWANRIAASLDRGARPTEDPAWVQRNLEAPLGYLAGLIRELG